MLFVGNLALAAAYFAGAIVSQYFAIPPGNVCPFWIPAGIIFSVVCLYGYRFLPGVFLGAFFGNTYAYFDFEAFSNVPNALLSGSMNGLGDLVGVFLGIELIRKLKDENQLSCGNNIFLFLGIGGFLNALLSAIFGVTGLWTAGFITTEAIAEVFLTWWIGDAAGIIFLAPLFLTLNEWKDWSWLNWKKSIELAILSYALFYLTHSLIIESNLTIMTALPILLWSTFRFPRHLTFTAMVFTLTIISLHTNLGEGPFYDKNTNQGLLELLSYLFALYGTVLVLLAMDEKERIVANALERSEKYNRLLISEFPIGLALCNMDGKLIDINGEYASMLGRSIEETKELTYWEITPEKYMDQESVQLETLAKTGSYGPYEKEYIHKNGHFFPVRLKGTLIQIDGRDYIWSSVEDISKEKENKVILKKALEKADAAGKAKDNFLSSISHELRTPLNAISGFSEVLLASNNPLNNDQTNIVREIHNAGDHLLLLINEILDLSKIESGRMSIKKSDFELNTLIQDCLNLSSEIAKKNNVHLSFERSMTEIFCFSDPLRVKQILLNLISNAIKYNHKDGAGKVELQILKEDGFVSVAVSDNGQGMSQDQLKRIFTPFERFHDSKETIEGTGIGLTLCKKLSELLEISFNYESELNKGSTFSFSLEESIHQTSTLLDLNEDMSSDQQVLKRNKPIKVFYVEDNQANLAMFEYYFKELEEKFIIETTSDPREALALAEKFAPDIVLLDIKLPIISGLDLVRIFKEHPQFSKTPVIALSANAQVRDVNEALAAGFCDYLTKPYSFKNLMSKIEEKVVYEQ